MLVESRPLLFYFMVLVSLVIGYELAIFPLSPKFLMLRPEIVALLVIYWIMSVPQHLGIGFAFYVGLWQDILEQGVWGAHALALVFVAYFCLSAYKRIINFSVWQQALWVMVLIFCHQLVVSLVQKLAGFNVHPNQVLGSAILTGLCWPLVLIALRRFRLNYRMV